MQVSSKEKGCWNWNTEYNIYATPNLTWFQYTGRSKNGLSMSILILKKKIWASQMGTQCPDISAGLWIGLY